MWFHRLSVNPAACGWAVAALLAVLAWAPSDAAARRGVRAPRIQGAWELVWPEPGPHQREIKLITATHFTWTSWDTGTRQVLGSGGGPYVLHGDTYQEQLLFASGGAESIAGTVQAFHVQVKGDSLFQFRPPGQGEGREIWRRLR